MDFTSDTALLSHAIDELYTMGDFKEFEHSNLDQDDGSIIRLIMIYTRSDVLPSVPDPEVLDVLAASGRFSYDCVYIHHKGGEVSGPIKPQHVYDRLTEMEDIRAPGYYYELTRVLKKYSSAMGELLAHPSVRAIQDEMSYKMKPPPSVRRMEEMAQQRQQLHLEQPTRQQQQQQIYQHHIRQQQASPSPKGDIIISYRGSDNSTGTEPVLTSSQNPVGFFGSSAPSPSPSPSPSTSTSRTVPSSRLPNSGPIALPTSHPTSTSPFASPKERERTSPSRGKAELPLSRQGSFAGSGNGANSVSGSGTGMDDAILI
ncbi:hypothetical protein BGX20_008127 [Mortierella sp. AD010]|nr:hypothetical protein BGX20_008127 [Mortierella sp. AD010]